MKIRGSIHDVGFLPEPRIERDANALIAEFARDHSVLVAPPVPIEDILELQLKVTFELDDLKSLLSIPDVLGALWVNKRLVKVDSSLDPSEDSKRLGRFRFTIAHEVGHWQLHRQYYREDPLQSKLFEGMGQPAFVCRSLEKPPVEWQADTYASYLLMPKSLLVPAWEAWRGNLDAVVLDDVPMVHAFPGRSVGDARLEAFVKPLAEQFEVSAEAMRIRLEKLGLLARIRELKLF